MRFSARIRPHVRGLRWMPICRKAAWMRNAPSSGFSCISFTVSIAFRSVLRAAWCGAERFVVQARNPFRDPAVERRVDRVAVDLQIGGDALLVPALAVQADDRESRFGGIGDLMVGRIAPRAQTPAAASFGEDALDGVRAGAVAEADPADRRDLMDAEGRMLRFEGEIASPNCGSASWRCFSTCGREEAGHPVLGEPRRLPVERALRRTGLLGAFRRRMAEEHDGTNQLIGELLGELGRAVGVAASRRSVRGADANAQARHSPQSERRTHTLCRVPMGDDSGSPP